MNQSNFYASIYSISISRNNYIYVNFITNSQTQNQFKTLKNYFCDKKRYP